MEWTEVGEQGGGQRRGHQRELTSRESWWCVPGWPHPLSELPGPQLCDKMYERVQPRGGGLFCHSFWGGPGPVCWCQALFPGARSVLALWSEAHKWPKNELSMQR